jgi:hypothetical protein
MKVAGKESTAHDGSLETVSLMRSRSSRLDFLQFFLRKTILKSATCFAP